jgi:undecaprenyl-diphosphatase
MSLMQVVILAVIQGLAELLPVSSSAHVIAAAKLMRGRGVTGDSPLDPSSPQFTLLLVMLHTGTMFAVIVYFWKAWKKAFFSSREQFWRAVKLIAFGHGANRSGWLRIENRDRENDHASASWRREGGD